MPLAEIDYEKWRKVILKLQLITAAIIFIVELVNNYILYITRSQGYGPDTIVDKLLRYLILTSVINFGSIILGQVLIKKIGMKNPKQNIILIMTLEIICINTAFSHYQFAVSFGGLLIPVLMCVLYEDYKLSIATSIVSGCGLMLSVLARGSDPEYNKDIVPEAAISFSLLFAFAIFSRIIVNVLKSQRSELSKMEILKEKAKYVARLDKKNQELMAEKENLRILTDESIMALSIAVEYNDHYTNGHSKRVAEYSKMIGARIGMSNEEIEELYRAGLLHDVGKIGVDNAIINKNGRLSDEEYAVIKTHPVMGYKILKGISKNNNFAVGAKWHHERYDGKGYPDGLEGEHIPLIARIIAVADSYDAMTSNRSYRNALPQQVVREELERGCGTQFDEKIAKIMIDIMDSDKNYDLRQKAEDEGCTCGEKSGV